MSCIRVIAAGLLLNNGAAVGGFVVATVRVGDEHLAFTICPLSSFDAL
jgi:nucleoside-triphosphatase THEP1